MVLLQYAFGISQYITIRSWRIVTTLVADGSTEDIWNNIKTGLLKTTEEVCGTTWPHRWRQNVETWWWNEHVEKAIAAKRKAFKTWKAGKGTRASYDAAKRNARHAVHHARQEANKKVCENIDPKPSEVYRFAYRFSRENTDVVGDKPVKNDAGEMSMSEDSKQKAWLEHYQRLLNVELTSQLQSFMMARYPLTGSRDSLSASTRERGTHWKGATTAVSS